MFRVAVCSTHKEPNEFAKTLPAKYAKNSHYVPFEVDVFETVEGLYLSLLRGTKYGVAIIEIQFKYVKFNGVEFGDLLEGEWNGRIDEVTYLARNINEIRDEKDRKLLDK